MHEKQLQLLIKNKKLQKSQMKSSGFFFAWAFIELFKLLIRKQPLAS